MAIEMKTLRQLYEEQAVEYRADAQALREATDYTKQYVKFAPNICDSSNRASTRIAWVERAERAFIEKHKREILQLAADLCEEAIGEPGQAGHLRAGFPGRSLR